MPETKPIDFPKSSIEGQEETIDVSHEEIPELIRALDLEISKLKLKEVEDITKGGDGSFFQMRITALEKLLTRARNAQETGEGITIDAEELVAFEGRAHTELLDAGLQMGEVEDHSDTEEKLRKRLTTFQKIHTAAKAATEAEFPTI